MTRNRSALLAALASLLVPAAPLAADGAAKDAAAAAKQLAPTGKLRVGTAVAPVASATFATRDARTGALRGVAVDLGAELARSLGVPVEVMGFPNSGELTKAVASGACDVGFMPVDAERLKVLDFSAPYHVFDSTYLVPAGSKIAAIADVDRPGVKVVAIQGTTTSRTAARVLSKATLTTSPTVDQVYEMLRAGQVDAAALSRDALESLAEKLPGARILDGHFHTAGMAAGIGKGKPAALAFVSAFVERAKSSGLVRRALDDAGLKTAAVAPPGGQP
jgi:polar amino acid transport system substrate-binding protein